MPLWEDVLRPIDLYCERTDFSWWAEPLGFTSNLGFFVAAYVMWQLAGRQSERALKRILQRLAFLALAIAIGSSLFHGHPNMLTKLADVIPIASFAVAFLWFYSEQRRREGAEIKPLIAPSLGLLTVPPVLVLVFQKSVLFAGGQLYLGLAPTLWLLASREPQAPRARELKRAALLFACALTARTLDPHLCALFPYGTHFIWHLLNAGVIYRLGCALNAGAGPDLASHQNSL